MSLFYPKCNSLGELKPILDWTAPYISIERDQVQSCVCCVYVHTFKPKTYNKGGQLSPPFGKGPQLENVYKTNGSCCRSINKRQEQYKRFTIAGVYRLASVYRHTDLPRSNHLKVIDILEWTTPQI